MKTSEVLNTAADIIEKQGWWQDGRDAVGVCASNAIARASEIGYHPAHERFIDHIGGVKLQDIFDWNDAPGRTAAEVVETLRAAAVIAEAREVEDARHARKVEAVRVLHGERVEA